MDPIIRRGGNRLLSGAADSHETDHGPVLPSECPGCRCRALRLIERRSAYPLLRFAGVGGCWLIRCAECSWTLDVPKAEAAGLRRLCALAADFRAGRLSQAALTEAIRTCGLASVDKVQARGATWTCAACGEAVPTTLDACWNCETPKPGLSDADGAEPAAADIPSPRDPLFGYALAAVQTEEEPPAADQDAPVVASPASPRTRDSNADAAR